jgi:hypothetical protein
MYDSLLLLSKVALNEAEEIVFKSERVGLLEGLAIRILSICNVRETRLH